MTHQMFLCLIIIYIEATLEYLDGFSKRVIHVTPIEWSNQAAIMNLHQVLRTRMRSCSYKLLSKATITPSKNGSTKLLYRFAILQTLK